MSIKNIFLGAALLGAGALSAQDPIRREVDVTRAYEPSVQEALKLNRLPDMTDTAQMRPDVRYEITPRPLTYNFAVDPLAPARFAAVDGPVRQPFYAKLGAGGPLQSVAEVRWSHASERFDLGAFASHEGRYGKIRNDMEISESAFGTDNRAGMSLRFRPTGGFSIDADAGYRFRNVTRYGYYGPAPAMRYFDLSEDALKQFFHNPYAKVSLGTDFKGPQRVHFRVGGGVDYVGDRYKYDQTRWDLDATLGIQAGNHGFVTLGTEVGFTRGQNNLKGYKNRIVQAEAAYSGHSDGAHFRIGLGFGGSAITSPAGALEDTYHFLPQLSIEKMFFNGRLTPFAELQSEIEDNSFGELIKRNPYVFSGTTAPNTIAYRTRVGAKGTLGGLLKYKLYGGYDRLQNVVYWANAEEYSSFGNAFTTLADNLSVFRAGIEWRANILDALALHGAMHYAHYDSKRYAAPGGMPKFRVEAGAIYNHRNRLYLTTAIEAIGPRTMYGYRSSDLQTSELPAQVDLRVGVEYWLIRRFGLFLQANNLLNQRVYEFNHYRELGLNVIGGVKVSF